MFDVADKDKTGNISFGEFYSFLQTESKAEAAKQKDNVVVAAHDPVAQRQAAREEAPLSALRNPMQGQMQKAMLHGMGFQGTAIDEMVAGKYTPGEVNKIVLEQINKCPEMKALYESNHPLVTDFFTHDFDHQRTQHTLAANPDLQKAYNAFVAQGFQASTGVTPAPGYPPPQAGYPPQAGAYPPAAYPPQAGY